MTFQRNALPPSLWLKGKPRKTNQQQQQQGGGGKSEWEVSSKQSEPHENQPSSNIGLKRSQEGTETKVLSWRGSMCKIAGLLFRSCELLSFHIACFLIQFTLHPHDVSSTLLQNVKLPSGYTVSYPSRVNPSYRPLSEPQVCVVSCSTSYLLLTLLVHITVYISQFALKISMNLFLTYP
jgi:hypothetical protein